jgi:DNA polymerase III alpha subunit
MLRTHKKIKQLIEEYDQRIQSCKNSDIDPEIKMYYLDDLTYAKQQLQYELDLINTMKPFRYTLYVFIVISIIAMIILILSKYI